MILLDKTSCELLRYLIGLQEAATIMTISRELGQSRRKVYYHLEKINDALADYEEEIVSQPRVGILLTEQQKNLCRELLLHVDTHSYILSANERMQLVSLYICTAKERVTIEKLMDLTDVSRNTVLNDLNDIRNQLTTEQYLVNLYSTKARGYYLDCHPLNKIQYVHSLLYHIFIEGSQAFVDVLVKKFKELFDGEVLLSHQLQSFLSQQVPLVEQDLGKKINSHEIGFMLEVLPYLLLSCRNMELEAKEENSISQEFSLIRKRIEYRVAKLLSERMEHELAIRLSDIEISLLAVLLLSYRKDKDIHATSQDFAQLQEALEAFLWRFEASSYEIENRDDLLRNLLTHCKALLFRKTYGIMSKNPLTRLIKSKYADLFTFTKSSAVILEEAWFVALTDDDIAYLTIHIGGSLKNSQAEQQDNRQIYLVCDEGVGLSKLLLKQCRYYLPNERLEAVFTTEQFKSVEDVLTADLLITTNEDLETDLPVIQVHPILDHEDILNISHFVMTQSPEQANTFNHDLEKLLSCYVKDVSRTQELKEKIQKLVHEKLLTSSAEDTEDWMKNIS